MSLDLQRPRFSANVRAFATRVRSPLAVRTAFDGIGLASLWWRMILALHGRPVAQAGPPSIEWNCIADGFRFYGHLYRFLAALLAVLAVLSAVLPLYSIPLTVSLLLCSAYLWQTTSLAYAGGKGFVHSRGRDVFKLVAFLFFIAVFLASFTTVVTARWDALVPGQHVPEALRYVLGGLFITFGIGSYMIELAYLTTDHGDAHQSGLGG